MVADAGGQILVAAAATCGIHNELDPRPMKSTMTGLFQVFDLSLIHFCLLPLGQLHFEFAP
jgi:hypothetical protein